MPRRFTSPTLFLAFGLFALACSDGGSTKVDEEVRHLRRTGDGAGYVVVPGGIAAMGELPNDDGLANDDALPNDGDYEDGGGMDEPGEVPWDPGLPDDGGYYPDPGMPSDCAFLRYREISTTVLDSAGDVISTAYEYCTQCFGADLEPVGDESCSSDPLPPPPAEPVCWEEWAPDGTVCSACIDETGVVIEDTCGYYTDPGYPTEPTDPGDLFCWVDTAPDGGPCDVCIDAAGLIVVDACGYYTEPPPPVDDCTIGFCEARPDCCEGVWDATCDADLVTWCGDPGFPPDEPGVPGEPCPPPYDGSEPDDDGTSPDGM